MSAEVEDQLPGRLARHVREARDANGVSLSQLAVRAGVGKATVAAVESGTANATLSTVSAIARALGVEPCELICRDRWHH